MGPQIGFRARVRQEKTRIANYAGFLRRLWKPRKVLRGRGLRHHLLASDFFAALDLLNGAGSDA